MNIDTISELYPDAITADGFDDCIIGVTIHGQVVYDARKMIDQLSSEDGMDQEMALEYFEYNIAGAYVWENTPIYIYT